MEAIRKLTNFFKGEVGYLEKQSNAHLDDKTANAGDRNYTKYGAYFGHNGPDAYWCDYFVDYCFCQTFGRDLAKQLLGGLSGYTPTSAGYFKKMGQWHTENPQEGDIVFFMGTDRINHTGYVYKVSGSTVYTIEGNTSSASGVVRNGGAVAYKEYPVSSVRIAGYGRPDYTLVEPITKSGWVQEDGGWRLYLGDTGQYVANKWYKDGEDWYWFDGAGMMVHDTWYRYKGDWYYLGSDGAMCKGQVTVDGKWYILDNAGRMIVHPVTLTPDQDGALQFPGLAQ